MGTRRLLLFLAIALISLGACRKPAATQPSANSNDAASYEAPVGGKALAGDKFYFRGTIANNLAIEMTVTRDGDRLTGTYFYPKVGKNINLAGTVDKDGNVELKESDESGKNTGVFKGKWKPATDSPDPALNEIEGKWSKPDGTKETAFQVLQQPLAFTAAVRVTPKVIKEANKAKHYTVDAEYPQIEGDARFDNFNREARNLITKDVAAFRTSETSEETDAGSETPAETLDSTLDIGYEIRYATDDLISVEFTEGSYERGAAHGNSGTTVVNYDVKNGKKLALADLFNPRSNFLSLISEYCLKDLRERSKKDKDAMFDEEMMKSGASARADNYRAWAITKKGLWITFDPYAVAPYAAGPQHVLVPYSALKDILKPDGPVSALAK
ncbi:MAG: hypothetical protein QOG23_610 [Blastocatellia bacterium]|jgi:hypothetical protein|nr:hypothetical protein [Blastocatellia bacterium]